MHLSLERHDTSERSPLEHCDIRAGSAIESSSHLRLCLTAYAPLVPERAERQLRGSRAWLCAHILSKDVCICSTAYHYCHSALTAAWPFSGMAWRGQRKRNTSVFWRIGDSTETAGLGLGSVCSARACAHESIKAWPLSVIAYLRQRRDGTWPCERIRRHVAHRRQRRTAGRGPSSAFTTRMWALEGGS